MSSDGDIPGSEKGKRSMLVEALAALLEALRKLYKQISARLWHRRMEPPPPSGLAGDSTDISDTLNGHIERTAAEAETSAQSADGPAEPSGQSMPVRKKNRQRLGFRLFSGLSRHLRRPGRSAGYQRLGEKMRADTLRHINDALRLARRGDAQAARVHTELAESAMRTASQYLSEEEYRAFKQDVESRLKEVVRDQR